MKNNLFRPTDSFQSNTDRTLILVDFSNLMYRAWFVSKEMPWIAFCKFFDMLRLCVHKSKQPGVPVEVIFAGESQTKLKRSEIVEEHVSQRLEKKHVDPQTTEYIQWEVLAAEMLYKGTRRPNKNPEFAKFRKDLEICLGWLGYKLLRNDGSEADDVIAGIVAGTCHRCFCKTKCANCDCASRYKTDVVIFSGDKDLQQLLAWDRVFIYRAPGIFVGKEDFEEEYGFPVAKYGVYKALIGDKSDNIAGVDGFGPVKAKIAINADTVAEDIWELGGEKAADEFKLALKLVNLDTSLRFDLSAIFSGTPQLQENELVDKLDKRIIFEIVRWREEFV